MFKFSNFSTSSEQMMLRQRVSRFIASEVVPLETAWRDGEIDAARIAGLRARARAAGIYGPQIPRLYGGLELGLAEVCVLFEEAGRSLLGPLAMNCAAPDEGNMQLLGMFGDEQQRERYLRPLAEGEIRSCFAMTEPAPGCGSDPAMMKTHAARIGDEWEINGHKWFVTGAQGASVAITMAITDPQAHVHQGATLFLVPCDAAGFTIVRQVPTMGSHTPGGHCEILYQAVRVPHSAVLGQPGHGFRMAQARLGPARLTHCMRWLGAAQRSLEIAAARALEREAFGKKLSEHQAIQWMLADSEIDLHASRMMVLHAASMAERGEDIRRESSICKVFVSEAVSRVIDRAVQICGALGISCDLPLENFYREVRAFRIYDGASEVHRMVIARDVLQRTAREAGD